MDLVRIEKLEQKVSDMEIRLAVTERDVKGIKEDIKSIRDDTRWLRRAFTGALITTGVSVTIGSIVGLVVWVIKGGMM